MVFQAAKGTESDIGNYGKCQQYNPYDKTNRFSHKCTPCPVQAALYSSTIQLLFHYIFADTLLMFMFQQAG